MLPGFRLVVATVVLAVSLLVFGLGAAALLRASHEQFAALPPAQAPRDPMLAREPEARQATLALLRVEMMAEQSEAAKTPAEPVEEAMASPVAVVVSAPLSPARADDAPARVETLASDAAPIAPRIAVGDAGDKLSAAPAAPSATSAEAKPAAARDDNTASAAAQADNPGCVPTLPSSELLALLVDPALLRPGAALKPASLEGPAIHRVRRARHRHARLRHHRLLLRAQAQVSPFAAQQNNPFGVFPAAR